MDVKRIRINNLIKVPYLVAANFWQKLNPVGDARAVLVDGTSDRYFVLVLLKSINPTLKFTTFVVAGFYFSDTRGKKDWVGRNFPHLNPSISLEKCLETQLEEFMNRKIILCGECDLLINDQGGVSLGENVKIEEIEILSSGKISYLGKIFRKIQRG